MADHDSASNNVQPLRTTHARAFFVANFGDTPLSEAEDQARESLLRG